MSGGLVVLSITLGFGLIAAGGAVVSLAFKLVARAGDGAEMTVELARITKLYQDADEQLSKTSGEFTDHRLSASAQKDQADATIADLTARLAATGDAGALADLLDGLPVSDPGEARADRSGGRPPGVRRDGTTDHSPRGGQGGESG